MHSSRLSMGYTEKKVSINAVIAAILGMILNGLQAGMLVSSILYKGKLPLSGGVVESYILLLSIFGLLWGVLSLDDEKTVGKYKRLAIVLNGIALAGAVLIMILGCVS